MITLNLVPAMMLSIRGAITRQPPMPVADVFISRWMASSSVMKLVVCQAMQTLIARAMLPIQLNF